MTQPHTTAKKVSSVALGLLLLLSITFVPRPAHAIFGVADISFDPATWFQDLMSAFFSGEDNLKEFVLDPLAWAAAKAAINSLSQSTVNWINSGFEGSPAYETDLRRSMGQLQDSAANNFFRSLEKNTGIDVQAPFQENVYSYLRQSYYRSTDGSRGLNSYNLNKTAKDDKAFLQGKFVGNGGWDAWFSTIRVADNNTYGAVFKLEDQLLKDVESFRVQRLNELQWGKGFLAWKGSCVKQQTSDGDAAAVGLSQEDNCLEYETRTPGTVIESQLENQLGSSVRQLEIADEIDEIVGALMQQLINQVLSESGLSGVSKPSSGGGRSYIDRASDPSGNGGSLGESFLVTIDALRKRVVAYQGHWQSILDIANEARASCATNNQDQQEGIQEVIEAANAGLAKAETALAAIDEFRAKVVAANEVTTNRAAALAELASEYQRLMQSGKLPTIQEMGEAEYEAKDIGDVDPGTMYSNMKSVRDECRKK